MAKNTSVIKVGIFADAQQFKKAVGDAGNKLGDFGGKVGRVSGNVVKGFGIMAGAAGGLALVVGKQLFDVGTELVSLDQKIATVFSGESADKVSAWADTVAARMGLTSTQAQGLAAGAADLLKPMGFTSDVAADMATEVVGLSGALSEWSAGQSSVEETANILQKALLGEREGLKQLGISINQAEVDQAALTIAQADGREEINAMDKAMATQQLILSKSTDAQAAFAAGGNKLLAAQNKLKARFGELKETLARKLLPLFAKMADIVVELIEVFDKKGLAGVIANVKDRIREAWPQIRAQLAVWARGFVDWVKAVVPPLLAALGALVLKLGNWSRNTAVPAIIDQLAEWATAFWDWAKDVVPPFLRRMGDLLADFGTWFTGPGLDLIVTKLATWAAAFLEWIGPMIPPLLRKLGGLLADIGIWMIDVAIPQLLANVARWTEALIGWVADVSPGVIAGLWGLVKDLLAWAWSDGLPALVRLGKTLGGFMLDGLKEGLSATLSGLGSVAKSVVNAIIRLINSEVIDRLNLLLDFTIMGVRVNPPDIPGIPALADGGIVTSPTLALVGEAGPEAVVPLNRAGGFGGNTNITVVMPAGSDGDAVVRQLQEWQRRHGALPLATGTARY